MKFQVFKEGKVLTDFNIGEAFLFGDDGIAIKQAKIAFQNGLIECSKPNLITASFSLVWEVSGFGNVMLATTYLPEREKPYILNLEIARAKLMQLIIKREDWQFFDGIEGLEDTYKASQNLFIKAVQSISDPALASTLADQSLEKSVLLSEQLAAKRAESLLTARVQNRVLGKGCLGGTVDIAKMTDVKYLETMLELFRYVNITVSWADIEQKKGVYNFAELDKAILFFTRKKLAVGIGPLLCFKKEFLPNWLIKEGRDFDSVKEAAYKFVTAIVTRYTAHIKTWRVISGLNVYNYLGFSFEQVLEITRAACLAAKAVNDQSAKIIDVCELWGEYYSYKPNCVPPVVYMDLIVQNGIQFDAFGLPMMFGKDENGMHVRDMMQISAMFDYIALIGKTCLITELAVPSDVKEDSQAGTWHEKWSEKTQSQWLEQFYTIALSKPFIDSVVYGNLMDDDSAQIPDGGLIKKDGSPKQAVETIKAIKQIIFAR